MNENNLKSIKIPKKDENLAEFVGLMLGDGNIYSNKKRGVYQIKVTNNSVTDKEYIYNFVKPLIENLFGVNTYINFEKNRKGVNIRAGSMNLIKFLYSIGLKPGNKIKNNLDIPNWIKTKNNLLIPCIRGLFDTDGTVYYQTRQRKNLVIGFKNSNKLLLKTVRESLIKLKFHPTKIIINAIFITRRAEVKQFNEKISFNNPKHKMKFIQYSPVV